MFTNLDNIDKVIKILSKSLSKRYPYLSNIQINKIEEDVGTIRIDIDLDLNKFLEYYKLRLRPNLDGLLTTYVDDIEYLESLFLRKLYYLNTWLPDDEELNDLFGYKMNDEITSYLSEMMGMLPSQLIPTYKYHSILNDTMMDYPIDFRVMSYNTKFDPERYIEYTKNLD